MSNKFCCRSWKRHKLNNIWRWLCRLVHNICWSVFCSNGLSAHANLHWLQAGSAFSHATGDVGSVFQTVTCKRNILHCPGWIGLTFFFLAIGGSLATVVTSEGGEAITLATSGAGKVTSFAGSQYIAATAAVGSAWVLLCIYHVIGTEFYLTELRMQPWARTRLVSLTLY